MIMEVKQMKRSSQAALKENPLKHEHHLPPLLDVISGIHPWLGVVCYTNTLKQIGLWFLFSQWVCLYRVGDKSVEKLLVRE